MSGSETTYEVTNQSSRSFIFGELTILPHVPLQVSEEQKGIIEASHYSEYFTFTVVEPPLQRQEQDTKE